MTKDQHQASPSSGGPPASGLNARNAVSLDILGPFSLHDAHDAVNILPKKAQALLAYVAMHPRRLVSRDKLTALIWTDNDADQARHSLRQCLVSLRAAFTSMACGALVTDGANVMLAPSDSITVDVHRFEALSRSHKPEELAAATGLYRDEFLAGLQIASEPIAEWITLERRRLSSTMSDVLFRLAGALERKGDVSGAIDIAQRLTAFDPLREDGYRLLMRLLTAVGKRSAALAQHAHCVDILRRELDIGPEPETARLAEAIRKGEMGPSAGPEIAGAPGAMAVGGVSTADPAGRADGHPLLTLALSDKPSIAVLPFENISAASGQDYFADGITEDIITGLSRLKWLFVIARNSTFTYKGRAVDVRQIGRELGVRYVLEGSVRVAAGRARITAQLAEAATGNHLWAEHYDRQIADVFAVQDEITASILATIEPRLYAAEGSRARHKHPDSLEAWNFVAHALTLVDASTRQNIATMRELLGKAVALDPAYSQAHALLAFATAVGAFFGWSAPEDAMASAWESARLAVRLDVDDPWAHFALGFVRRQRGEVDAAIAEFQQAVALNPSFAFAHSHLGVALCGLGNTAAGLVHIDTAERLSPRGLAARFNCTARAMASFVDRRYQDGIDFARKATRESPDEVAAYRLLVANLACAGEIEEAGKALAELRRLVPDISLRSLEFAARHYRDADRRRFIEAFRLVALE
jgi:TolB-like protein/DNA-binding SARP family transcriptional activator/Flp pilus assembly protein TadD